MVIQHEGRPHPVDASLYESIAMHVEVAGDAKKWRGFLGFGTSTFRGVLIMVLGAIVVGIVSARFGMTLHP